jgi:hypothetical protein
MLENRFVKNIPDVIEDNTLYVSMEYGTVIHNCMCGCSNEVVTPLGDDDWKLSYNGENISLHPSIGNWSLKCKSHYWIKKGEVIWAKKWDDDKIKKLWDSEAITKEKYYTSMENDSEEVLVIKPLYRRILDFFKKKL